MRLGLPLTALLFLPLVPAYAVAANQVRVDLANGDRLTGRLISSDAEWIRLDSPALGPIAIRADGASVTQLEPVPAPQKPPEVSTEAAVEVQTSLAALRVDADRPKSARPPWSRKIEVGITSQSGRRDRTDVSLRASAERQLEIDQYRSQVRYLYGEANSIKASDSLDANFRWRRGLSPKVFTQSQSSYSYDRVKLIRHNLEQNAGLGYRLRQDKNFSFSFGGGVTGRYRDIYNKPTDWELLTDFFQDLSYSFNSRFRLTEDLTVLVPPGELNNYNLRLNSALVGKITDSVNASFRFEFEWDNSLARNARRSQRIITTLGYAF
jgi:putative salt-induced outer membrane protein YdiY